ncbi:MAG: nitroreductase family protein [Dehalococcoidia bacterium]
MRLEEALADRRSVRRFDGRPVPPDVVRDLIALACTAPAPHHSRPWRFLAVDSAEAREGLAETMARRWRHDLEGDGVPQAEVARLLDRSYRRLREAPLLLLACIVLDQARSWPDERRRRAERDMFVQSLGAALQNLMLAAHARGLGSCLMGAPLFCPDAVVEALGLPPEYEPQFLVTMGYPPPGSRPPPRPELRADDFLLHR